ncbi:hypothetical protein MF271_18995 (plasmid) [Deinococcus sp. KNUC1210]|uniref:hypothetical protein n=1 Tax=Deinococcus sp. KNUC1210 TaxID=2917691 RepID=UPI001EF0F170|nr:hypothetical protein [Deinococcus sp. KNUC1210]ULH17409.1 hypothetical protein MF271_18995 [Deinococcus sp. KNUC1210]
MSEVENVMPAYSVQRILGHQLSLTIPAVRHATWTSSDESIPEFAAECFIPWERDADRIALTSALGLVSVLYAYRLTSVAVLETLLKNSGYAPVEPLKQPNELAARGELGYASRAVVLVTFPEVVTGTDDAMLPGFHVEFAIHSRSDVGLLHALKLLWVLLNHRVTSPALLRVLAEASGHIRVETGDQPSWKFEMALPSVEVCRDQ